MQCPICSKEISTNSICFQCGWELKSDNDLKKIQKTPLYKKKLIIAQKNWKALLNLMNQKKLLAGQVSKLQEHVKNLRNHPDIIKIKQEAIKELADENIIEEKPVNTYEKVPIPENIIKHDSETNDEFARRISEIDSIPIGLANIFEDQYNIHNGEFPLQIKWHEWIKDIDGHPPIDSYTYIFVDRQTAKNIFEAGSSHPINVKLKLRNDRLFLYNMELFVGNEKYTINMTWKEPETGMEFILLHGGMFMMGSSDDESNRYENEGPYHEVYLDHFWMGKYPVTMGQWKKIYKPDAKPSKKDITPANNVSWKESLEFLEKLNSKSKNSSKFKLPTEAEWEYACRANTVSPYCFGETLTSKQANFGGKYKNTTPVDKFEANQFGLYDMHGNVWEWCQDVYNDNAYTYHEKENPVYLGSKDPTDKTGGTTKVIRGGCWYREMEFMRSSYRYGYAPGLKSKTVGFRIVMQTLAHKD